MGPSLRHSARATLLLSKKCRSGGELLATLCPIIADFVNFFMFIGDEQSGDQFVPEVENRKCRVFVKLKARFKEAVFSFYSLMI